MLQFMHNSFVKNFVIYVPFLVKNVTITCHSWWKLSRFTRHFLGRVYAFKNLHLGKVCLFGVICLPLSEGPMRVGNRDISTNESLLLPIRIQTKTIKIRTLKAFLNTIITVNPKTQIIHFSLTLKWFIIISKTFKLN